MRNFLKAFLLFLVWAFFAQYLHSSDKQSEEKSSTKTSKTKTLNEVSKTSDISVKKIDSIKTDSTSAEKKRATSPKPFEENLTQLKFKHKFVTNANNTRVIFPKEFFYFRDSIFSFLNKNQQKEIIITAKHLPSETLPDGTNYGIARANYLKNRLVKYGVNPNRIITKSSSSDFEYDLDGFHADGITIEHRNLTKEKLDIIEKEITNKTLYSYFGDKHFKADRTLYAYMLEIKDYLKNNPNKTITITGHTDNVGDEKANEWIGLERAKNVATYFTQQGIDTSKIKTTSKGENIPIDDNTTKDGRAKNRRIEITIK
ncbi:hypothetical protein WH52_09960 [Tenacibaculum holothuriorum]|uniref:OmpA-like domain-containing protein n=1 Tax=Tenacibaculum holothuriorum TaxID=1635173 RepID=A0A1Y2PB95_9FLAO|nr:OmpA family protein [Tenacibaculum holothuriorum]OSY87743.1 hypothetical protein WH52_09960 [Tenacibaculum holothuriorum]